MRSGQSLLKSVLFLFCLLATLHVFGKSRGGKDAKQQLTAEQAAAVERFLRERQEMVEILRTGECPNCHLNRSCFAEDISVWTPSECGSSVAETGKDRRVLFIGDSRIRSLFAGLVQERQGDRAFLSRLNDKGREVQIPLVNLKLPNWKAEGGLQSDFNSTCNANFLWDPMLSRSQEDTRRVLETFRPDVVVYGAGIWFLAAGSGYSSFETSLEQSAKFLLEMAQLLNFRVIFYQHTMPTNFNHGRYNATNITELRRISYEVLSIRFSNVVIFNSHLPLQQKYVELCSEFGVPDVDEGEWMCDNANHSGFVVVSHFAKLLSLWIQAELT